MMMQIKLISLLAVLLVACAQNACGQDPPQGRLSAWLESYGFGRRVQSKESTDLPTDSSSPSSMIDDIPASAENETSDLPLEDKPSSAELDQQNQQSADLPAIDLNEDDDNSNNNNISNDTDSSNDIDSSNGRQKEQEQQQSDDSQEIIYELRQKLERLEKLLMEQQQEMQQQQKLMHQHMYHGPQQQFARFIPMEQWMGPPPPAMFGHVHQGTAGMPGQQQNFHVHW